MRHAAILALATLGLASCGQFGTSAESAGSTTGVVGRGGMVGEEGGGAGSEPGPGTSGGNVLHLGATNLCAAAAGSSTAANQNVVLSRCAATTRQLWTLAGGQLALGDGRCLMAPASLRVGTQAVVLPCAKVGARQGQWQLDGNQLTLAADNGRCLQAAGQAAGSAVGVVACDAQDATQQWALQGVPAQNPNTATPDPNDALDPAKGSDPNGGAGAQQPNAGASNGVVLDVNTTTKDTSALGGSPRPYSGPAINFPNDPARWDSWDNAWARAMGAFPGSNTPAQSGWIKDAILLESATTGMDARFILAVVMQESGGDVHVRTTNNGVRNPGLMQSHNGATFTDVGDGGRASIFQMVQDGVEGTKDGDGLLQGVRQTKNYFAAGRLYNSGQLDANNLSNGLGATASYCQDLANRVMGRL